MLADQSTSVIRSMLLLFLRDYKAEVDNIPDATRRAAAGSIVLHQCELVGEMPAAALADLFLRSKMHYLQTRSDDDLTKNLLGVD